MIPRRGRLGGSGLAISLLLTVAALDCATAPAPEPESARPAAVPGLVPISTNGSPPDPAATPGAAGAGGAAAPASGAGRCPARVGAHAVKRSALRTTLDAGLGTWLRGVDVEPKMERGHFQGWLVRRIYAGDPCWADVDLRAGDVVSRVNRRAIERPEQAQAVWTALRTSSEIVVELFRAGKPRTLRFAVVDDAE